MIEIRKMLYMSTGQVTMSDLLVHQFVSLVQGIVHRSMQNYNFCKNKHNDKTNSQPLRAAGYYYLLSQMHDSM